MEHRMQDGLPITKSGVTGFFEPGTDPELLTQDDRLGKGYGKHKFFVQ